MNSEQKNKLFGTKDFYIRVMKLTLPIMIQSGITNFVSMLDNIMVGKVGTLEMSGVSIANQILFVVNLCIFGAVSGAGIFGAQFFGKGDHEGHKHTFRFKIILGVVISVFGIFFLSVFGKNFIMLYLTGDDNPAEIEATFGFAKEYMHIMLIGIIPYSLTQCYAGTLREADKSTPPMVASCIAVGVNLFLNWVLIFGNLSAPKLGVAGAAVATVIARYIEFICISVWTFAKRSVNKFIVGAFRSFYVPPKLCKNIAMKGLPLMLNEALWSAGIAALGQVYSTRGLDAVAAYNIANTFNNLFSVAFLSLGAGVGIIIGQLLGTKDYKKAVREAKQLTVFSCIVSAACGVLLIACANFIPDLYETSAAVRTLATSLMIVWAFIMPFDSFVNSAYFILRAGGKVYITIVFDCCYTWGVVWLVGFLLSKFTGLGIVGLYAATQSLMFIKCILGYILLKKGIWLNQIV